MRGFMGIRIWVVVVVAAMGSIGCVTSPAPAGGRASAYAVGDRVAVSFDEIVVSLRLNGSSAPYQNFHITIKAFATPVRTTHSNPWAAQATIGRSEVRMSA